MAKVQVSVKIRASREAVWSVLEDIAGHTRWMHDAAAIRFVTPQRRGVGTAFDCDTRVGPLRLTDRMTITEWVPPAAMGVAHRGVVTGTGRFTLRRRRRHTVLRWEEQLRFPWRVGGPVAGVAAKPVLAAIWRRNLRSLEALVERG